MARRLLHPLAVRTKWIPALPFLAAALAASPATAADVAPADIRLNAGPGIIKGGTTELGPALTGLGTARLGFLQGGLLVLAGGELFGQRERLIAGAGGFAWRPGHLRFDLLGVAGAAVYTYTPCQLLCEGPTVHHATWVSPWFGARAGAAYNFGRRMAHFELGLAGLVGGSTSSGRDTASYYQERWFNGGRFRADEEHEFAATWHLGAAVTAGVTFDIGRTEEDD